MRAHASQHAEVQVNGEGANWMAAGASVVTSDVFASN